MYISVMELIVVVGRMGSICKYDYSYEMTFEDVPSRSRADHIQEDIRKVSDS